MNTPAISVLIMIGLMQHLLDDTLRSLLAQTFSNFEVICVGRDCEHMVLEHAVAGDSRFRSCPDADAGAAALRQAAGEYVIFLNRGDILKPDALEKLHGSLVETQADVTGCNFSLRNLANKEIPRKAVHTEWIPAGKSRFSYRDCPDYILRVMDPVVCNKMYRTDYLRDLNQRFPDVIAEPALVFDPLSMAAAESIGYLTDDLVCTDSDRTGTLDDVRYAVFRGMEYFRRLPHSAEIENAITSFAVNHLVLAMARKIRDFSGSEATAFYNMAHETFNRQEFAAVSPASLRNPLRYREFCTVKKHDHETMKKLVSRRLIVSLTSFPGRIHCVSRTLETIYAQTKKPHKIILWLAEDQFPGREADIPGELRKLAAENRLTIRWCDDLKPHKKYFYALQEFRDDLVVTIDDDLLFSPNTLSSLYASYLLYPNAVSTVRAHLILLDEKKRILPYSRWIQETDSCIHKPSMQLMATGGAGVLYPPGIFRKEFFDAAAIRENCLRADDLWLKAMQLVSGVPVVVARTHEPLQIQPDSQTEALHVSNVRKGQNDIQMANIIRWTDKTFGPGTLVKNLTDTQTGETILGMEEVSAHLDAERLQLRRKYVQTDNKLKQSDNKLKQSEKRNQQAEEALRLSQENLERIRSELRGKEETLLQTERERQRISDLLQEERRRYQLLGQRTEQTRLKLEAELEETRLLLQKERENAPIGRQLKNVGIALRKQREAGEGTFRWGFKRLVYLLAWVPEKLLTGMMYYLRNGAKQTIKRIFHK